MGTLKRIKQYIEFKGINNKQFEESVGFSNGSFASQLKNNRTIGVDKLENILFVYTDINAEWLLTGKGDMLKTSKVYPSSELAPTIIEEQESVYGGNISDIDISKLGAASKDELINIIKKLLVINDRDSISIEKMVETADRNSITLSRLVDVLYGEAGIKGGSREMEANAG
ncbi:hypothetical protein M2451_003355 [Dysgonomonas sp. PFB1-18]|uniref:hypothetical protein n=1 Tax=unclassified Dysgonomonas TaxID=2630389 RepID=UPI002474738C|nr:MULTISPECIES: hypothetical protein [unclassified Dysgonomonas]MDH6310555.1 hypothetical protein [Dysgonomonas sp. PF1-14]MDH6340405.1 hypothetical protein [Dysgonomonas sp. PF1-16]MDH6382015.1 hypothetical protein [Dysgonomonas sp. PFB1-18]MDH6399376.1 hypothetical protein [Dysgonomonas sp. PF1-23]